MYMSVSRVARVQTDHDGAAQVGGVSHPRRRDGPVLGGDQLPHMPAACARADATRSRARSRTAPHDLAEHFALHGDHFGDGQILESTRAIGSGKPERERRVVSQWSFKRSKRDDKGHQCVLARR
jgi:hypothetical protein